MEEHIESLILFITYIVIPLYTIIKLIIQNRKDKKWWKDYNRGKSKRDVNTLRIKQKQ